MGRRKIIIPKRTCQVCGMNIPRNTRVGEKRISPKQYATARFCSRRCKGQHHASLMRGKGNPNYKHGESALDQIIRGSYEYRKWRLDVFFRDSFTCQVCGYRGRDINAHHIKPFRLFKEERLNVENGITLCTTCHQIADNLNKKKYEI